MEVSATKFKPGQTVYSAEGYAYEYVGELAGRQFVRDLYEDDYQGYAHYEPRAWEGPLFEKAPRHKRDEEIAEAQARLKAIRDEEQEARKALAEAQAERETLTAKHEEFRLLIDYLEGRITHVVVDGYQVEILPLADILVREDSRDGDTPRAIGLFAAPNPIVGTGYHRGQKVTWTANKYRDGSGKWDYITPCRSEAEAREVVQAILDVRLSEWRETGRGWTVERVFEKNPWLQAPQDWLDAHQAAKVEAAQKALDEAKKTLASAERNLKAIQAGEEPVAKGKRPRKAVR